MVFGTIILLPGQVTKEGDGHLHQALGLYRMHSMLLGNSSNTQAPEENSLGAKVLLNMT